MSSITHSDIAAFRDYYRQDAVRQAMTKVFAKADLGSLTYIPQEAARIQYQFNVEIKTMTSTNQKSSGRCWLYAATNVLREIVGKKLNMESFEFSQSWLAFWDKFERVNAYLDAICETASLPHDDRMVDYLVGTGIGDGGQWDMFVNIVDKYGLVPKTAFPETAQTSATGEMNRHLNLYLRAQTARLRDALEIHEDVTELRRTILEKVFSFLCACYGEPPEKFDFEYKDRDGVIHFEENLDPTSFRDQYIGDYLDHYVSLINAPAADKPFYRAYTVKYLNNVLGAQKDIYYYNVPIEELKAKVIQQLKDGEIVWFGSDVGKYRDRENMVWNDTSFNEDIITGFDTKMTKEQMLWYHSSQMNHAMCITGVNIGPDGKPNRWKIENSWGTDGPNGGYYIGSDTWFDKMVYQAVLNKKYLTEYKLDMEPIVLNPWDPMGSLAD